MQNKIKHLVAFMSIAACLNVNSCRKNSTQRTSNKYSSNDETNKLSSQPNQPTKNTNANSDSGSTSNTAGNTNFNIYRQQNADSNGVFDANVVYIIQKLAGRAQGDKCSHLGRSPGDPYRYDYCGNNNSHLSGNELHTLNLLIAAFKQSDAYKKLDPNCSCNNVYPAIQQVLALQFNNKNIVSLTPFTGFIGLKMLDLSHNKIPSDGLIYLSYLTKLQVLKLSYNGFNSIQSLARMPYLRAVYLAHTQVSDINPLTHLNKLSVVDISDTNVINIVPLLGLSPVPIIIDTGDHIKVSSVGEKHSKKPSDCESKPFSSTEKLDGLWHPKRDWDCFKQGEGGLQNTIFNSSWSWD